MVTEMKDEVKSAFSDLVDTVKSLHSEVTELKKSLGYVTEAVSDAEKDFQNL